MSRFFYSLVSVLLCMLWQCSAEQTAQTRAAPASSDFMDGTEEEALYFAEKARKKIRLARSAQKLAAKAAKHVLKSQRRAHDAIRITEKSADAVDRIAKHKHRSHSAHRAADNAVMAMKMAQELYGNEVATPTLIEEHMKWFNERHDKATKLEKGTLSAAIKALKKESPAAKAQSVLDVVRIAGEISTLAENAENDAKDAVIKRLYNQLLAERVEFMRDVAEQAEKTAQDETNAKENTETCAEQSASATTTAANVFEQRRAATKAYLSAASALKITTSCVSRIAANMTKVRDAHQNVLLLMANGKKKSHKKLSMFQSIADEAHTNAEDCQKIASTTTERAEVYVKEAKSALDSITLCVSIEKARQSARVAEKSYKKALDEMQLAAYQLFGVTVSLQQVTDAKKAIEDAKKTKTSKTAKKDAAAVDTGKVDAAKDEKKAMTSLDASKTAGSRPTDIAEIVNRLRQLNTKHGSEAVAAKIEEQLRTLEEVLKDAKPSAPIPCSKDPPLTPLQAFVEKKDVTPVKQSAGHTALDNKKSEEANTPQTTRLLREIASAGIGAAKTVANSLFYPQTETKAISKLNTHAPSERDSAMVLSSLHSCLLLLFAVVMITVM